MYGWTNTGAGFPRYDLGVVITANRWPMQSYGQTRAESLIVDFIADWLGRADGATRGPEPARAWAWKRSYVIGLIMGHSYHGALQARHRLTNAQLAAMAEGAVVRSGGGTRGRWHPDGFRVGYDDVAPIAADPAAVKAFLASTSLKVNPAELDLLFADVGGRGGLPPL